MSNAERQKRYRERNAPVTRTVTGAPKSVTRVTPESERNALALPGDADYVGCCRQDEHGVWIINNTKPSVKAMSDDELIRRLHFIKDWKHSPEHKERLRRRAVA